MFKFENFCIKALYCLDGSIAKDLLCGKTYPWEVLPHIGEYISNLGPTLNPEEYDVWTGENGKDNIWIAKSAKIAPDANIYGPAIIGPDTEVRHNAFIRGNVIVGENCVIGNATEIKNSILLNNVQVPHYNYVGDSILGNHAHLGAGVILSNLKSSKNKVYIERTIDTGLRKVGAFIGDNVEVGCNSVLNPGSIVGKNSVIYPLTCIIGYIPEDTIVSTSRTIIERKKKK